MSKAIKVLSNCFAIEIDIADDGENVAYRYSNEIWFKNATIDYMEDADNVLGYDNDDLQPCFNTDKGLTYFIGEFCRAD